MGKWRPNKRPEVSSSPGMTCPEEEQEADRPKNRAFARLTTPATGCRKDEEAGTSGL